MARPTLYAQRGLEFVAVFQVKLANLDINGHRPLLRDPPGESTAGGKLATQHMVLQPSDPGAPAWTVGSVNVATQTAKLRTYDCMRRLHATRFRDRLFPLQRDPYQRFFDAVVALVNARGLTLEVENVPPEISAAPEGLSGSADALAGSHRRSGALWILIAVLVIAGAGAALLVTRGILRF